MNQTRLNAEETRKDNIQQFIHQKDIVVKNWIVLNAISSLIEKIEIRDLPDSELSWEQISVLLHISLIKHQVTPSMLAKYMLRERHTITEILKRMESKGLVSRYLIPENKKERPVQLTEKGKAMIESNIDTRILQDIFKPLTSAEKHHLIAILNKLMISAMEVASVKRIDTSCIKQRHEIIMQSLE